MVNQVQKFPHILLDFTGNAFKCNDLSENNTTGSHFHCI